MGIDKDYIQHKLKFVKDDIDVELIAHPLFFNLVNEAFRNLENTMDYGSECKIEVLQDGKSLRISTFGTCKYTREELRDNREFVATTIKLNDNGLISIENSNGTLYKADDYRSMGVNVKENYSGVLNTYYTNSVYDQNGIQLSHSVFGDNYELMGGFDHINIASHVLASHAHRPDFSTNPPRIPNLCENAYSEHTYRNIDDLAIAYNQTLNGICTLGKECKIAKQEECIYPIHTEYPERLGALRLPVATWSFTKEEYEPTSDRYGNSLEDILEVMRENFKEGIENSKTKQYDYKTYEALKEKLEKTHQR